MDGIYCSSRMLDEPLQLRHQILILPDECELKQCHEVRKDSNTEFHYCTKRKYQSLCYGTITLMISQDNCEKDGCKLLKGVDKATQKQSSFCDQRKSSNLLLSSKPF